MKDQANHPAQHTWTRSGVGATRIGQSLFCSLIALISLSASAHPCPICERDLSQTEDQHADFNEVASVTVLYVTNNNEIILGDRLHTLNEATQAIQQASQETHWAIRGEPQADWAICMQIYHAIREAGFEQVALTVAEQREPVAIHIDLDEEGNIQIDQQTYNLQELQDHLTNLHNSSPDAVCTIRVHASSSYEKVQPVVDCLTQAGFETINMLSYDSDSPTP